MLKKVKVQEPGFKVIQGNEACAEAAIDAGCRFFAGYPITPSTEIIEHMSGALLENDGMFLQAEDEISAMCAIVGARWGGSKSMTASSGPGFTLKQEALGYAIETETPVVVVDVQRGGPATGQPTFSSQQDIYQARYGSHGDYEIICLAPSSVQEMYDFTVKAFNLSEKYRTPVILLADEIIGHMRERITVPEYIEVFESDPYAADEKCREPFKRNEKFIPPAIDFFQGHNILVEGQLHDEQGRRVGHIAAKSGHFLNGIINKIRVNQSDIADLETESLEDATVAVISYGSVARASRKAVKLAREEGVKAGFIKINTVWPFPEEEIRKMAGHIGKIIVPEMNMGKYCHEIDRCLKKSSMRSVPQLGGNIHTPSQLLKIIIEEAEQHE
ncbi:MAG TPA: 2-oxoacid:acceptor oxidoreductase subunit alpha [Anaerovoracaceae bacterium]|nr:2-oxoacid:acceptor oxidoreductase subunit alpha [Anaerovoracaceae bacterium]